MKDQFIPYEEALALKELGFDEPCLAFYEEEKNKLVTFHSDSYQEVKGTTCLFEQTNAPLWQQAFDWFRKEHNLGFDISSSSINCHIYQISLLKETSHSSICWSTVLDKHTKSYEETRLACLQKLIEIVKNK
jgi:hypothetical protein